VGESPQTGVGLPDMKKISRAYGIPFARVSSHTGLKAAVRRALAGKGPYMLELMMDPWQPLVPKVTSVVGKDGRLISKPMEDMWPFLPRDEFRRNMIVRPVHDEV